jgi:hypothetical protein
MKSSKLFITGCDKTTRWQLDWFKKNYDKHNDTPLHVFDFDIFEPGLAGWFKKPAAMMEASKMADQVCWIDTDCEVRDDISKIFEYVVPNKLTMAQDKPWSTRRQETWHNSGVVAFQSIPVILKKWAEEVQRSPVVGDQEVLHTMIRIGMNRLVHIEDLPRQYNTLRIDLIDKSEPNNIKVMHWTGRKGKEEIMRQMNG